LRDRGHRGIVTRPRGGGQPKVVTGGSWPLTPKW
jgi:hypothetical protein